MVEIVSIVLIDLIMILKKNYKKVIRNDFQQKCKAINLMTFLIADSTRISSLRLWCFL